MTFEEQMRIIELKELNTDDQRKVFTKLVCVYFENKNNSLKALNEYSDQHENGFINGSTKHESSVIVENDLNHYDMNLKRSFSASNVSSSLSELKSGNKLKKLIPLLVEYILLMSVI